MRVLVIGGGAAGCMAAGVLGSRKIDTILLERNEKLGKKLFITGKGRCNITNNVEPREFLENVVNNSKFLMSAIHTFTPQDTIEFCEKYRCYTKVERGNRVFPASDKSLDFIIALEKFLHQNNVDIRFNARVDKLIVKDGSVCGVQLVGGEQINANKVLIATGGASYPGTGSTGDGYTLAKSVGHTIEPLRPSLININTVEDVSHLAGVSLKNVQASIKDINGKTIATQFGEMLFTHEGVSGPIILSLSAQINKLDYKTLKLSIDLKPALDDATLDARIISDFNKYCNKELKNGLSDLLISSLREPIINASGIDGDKKINKLTKQERKSLLDTMKNWTFSIQSLGGLAAAIVTAGGVSVKEVSPSDMQSKLVKGLYFAGEVLDVDAYTGGFNIQIALSTGYLAATKM